VALQAMAMGLPIVGTDIGGVPEVLLPSGAGTVVPVGDPSALADAVRELLADPARRARMGEAGRAFVRERHSLERMLDETVHAYEEVLASCAR
jgi:glycosyltransferase involved in cell wall biosynthesis